jgi:hypothetical protein
MAVNKNFVVKNGLEVDTNTLFVDSANNRVAIGTTVPTASLDVRGKILTNSQVESWVGKFVGIVTAGAVGVTTMTTTDAVVSGFSTLGYANATSLNVTTGFSTVQSLTADDITVSIGATISKDLSVGSALTVTGATILSSDLNVGGATTVGGALTVTGNSYFNGNVDINGDLTYDEVNARNLNISGIATVGFATVGNMTVAGMTTTSLLNVGFGATMLKVQGTPATRVGINSIVPAYTLDVDGDSNVTGTARQGGTSIVTLASAAAVGDATALAIALG